MTDAGPRGGGRRTGFWSTKRLLHDRLVLKNGETSTWAGFWSTKRLLYDRLVLKNGRSRLLAMV